MNWLERRKEKRKSERLLIKDLKEKGQFGDLKTLLEIREFEKPFWRKPPYLAALLPALLTILTLGYGLTTGYFQAAFARLQDQKAALESQKTELENKKAALEEEIKRREDALKTNDQLQMDLRNKEMEAQRLRIEMERLKSQQR